MEDIGIDTIIRIDIERRRKYLQDYFNIPADLITKDDVFKAFEVALDKQAIERNSDSRVTKISLDGAENEVVVVERFTKDFLELSGKYNFRVDTKLNVIRDEGQNFIGIQSLEFTLTSCNIK